MNVIYVCVWLTEEAKSLDTGVVSHLGWVLGTKFRSSGRAANFPSAEPSLQLLGLLFVLFCFALCFVVFKSGC